MNLYRQLKTYQKCTLICRKKKHFVEYKYREFVLHLFVLEAYVTYGKAAGKGDTIYFSIKKQFSF